MPSERLVVQRRHLRPYGIAPNRRKENGMIRAKRDPAALLHRVNLSMVVVRTHFPFGPRGSMVSGRQIVWPPGIGSSFCVSALYLISALDSRFLQSVMLLKLSRGV